MASSGDYRQKLKACRVKVQNRVAWPARGHAPMRTGFALGLAVSLAALGAGCSSARVTQPLPISADTYTVSARTPHGGAASARDAALSAANQQCARLSKQLLVLKSSNDIELNENKDVVSDITDVTFRCLAAGDSALRRPN